MKKKAEIEKIFERFQAENPTPKTELIYHSEFELLVAVMLSAQATDIGVNKVTEKLFKIAKTPEAVLKLGEENLRELIKSINYFKNKAKFIIKTAAILLSEHQGRVPHTKESLEKLPGVGRKTANVILNVLFNLPTVAVDTHIFRVSHRIGLAQGKTPEAVEIALVKKIPKKFIHQAHHWLVLHGRYVCKARKPECQACLIENLCEKNLK